MLRLKWAATLVAGASLLLGVPWQEAAAQSHRTNKERCLRADDFSDAALVIAACTDAISAGLLQSRAEFAVAYNNRAMARDRLGEDQQALADYDRSIELYPFIAGIFNNRALVRADAEDHAGAIADLTEAIRLEPELATAYYNRARFYSYGLGEHQRALPDYERAIELAPDRPRYRALLCWHRAAFMRAEFNRALSDCNLALEREPRNATFLNMRALVQLQRGDFQAALGDYDAVIQLAPNMSHALYGRGIARLRLAQTAEGEADIAAALARDARLTAEYEGYGIAR